MTTVFRLREAMDSLPETPSLRSVALRAGVSYTTAHAIYHNGTHRVDLATLDALAKALGCEPGDLIGRASRPTSRKRGVK